MLKNQQTLDELYKKKTLDPSAPDPQYLEVEQEEELKNIKNEEDNIEAITECENCHEELNESSLDHHVCPQVKTEVLENDDEDLDSSMEQESLNDPQNKKKKYPKKKLKDPISCPKCDRQFWFKAYFQ